MRSRQHFTGFFALMLVACLSTGAAARSNDSRPSDDDDRYRDSGRGGNEDEWFRQRGNSLQDQFPSAEVHDAVVAYARAANARAVFSRAQTVLDIAVRQARRNFEQSPEVVEAMQAEQAAYDAYLAARNEALASLTNDPKYQAILSLRDELSSRIASSRRSAAATEQAVVRPVIEILPVENDVVALAIARMGYSSDVHAMENEVLRNNGRVKDAQARLIAANARVSKLRSEFDDAVRNNPDLQRARADIEDARIERVTASAYLYGSLSAADRALGFAHYLHRYDGPGYSHIYAPYGYGDGYGYGYGYGYRTTYGSRIRVR